MVKGTQKLTLFLHLNTDSINHTRCSPTWALAMIKSKPLVQFSEVAQTYRWPLSGSPWNNLPLGVHHRWCKYNVFTYWWQSPPAACTNFNESNTGMRSGWMDWMNKRLGLNMGDCCSFYFSKQSQPNLDRTLFFQQWCSSIGRRPLKMAYIHQGCQAWTCFCVPI